MAAAAEVFSDSGDEITKAPHLEGLQGGLLEDSRQEEEMEFTPEEEVALFATIECLRAARAEGDATPTPEQMTALQNKRDSLQKPLSHAAREKIVFFAHGPVLTPHLA
jgi:hypothetical protein